MTVDTAALSRSPIRAKGNCGTHADTGRLSVVATRCGVAVVVGPHKADTSTSLRDVLVGRGTSLESSDDIAGYGKAQSG